MTIPLSVLIPAGNEERHIAECIASARFADEVVVVLDVASSDRTGEIARASADRVLVHEYINSAAQKNWAIPQMTYDWVLVVDSDERVTDALRREIEALFESGTPSADGYRIFRQNHFMGRPIKGCGWQRDDVLRLFRRDVASYETKNVHADIEFADLEDPNIDILVGKLLHFTHESFDQYLTKFFRYGEWAAQDRAIKTPQVRWTHLAGRPAWRFFRQYVMYGGWRDGKAGFIICLMAAFSVFLKYARVWEMRERERHNQS